MAVLSLEDLSGSIEAVVFPETFSRNEALIKSEAALLVEGSLEVEDSGSRKIIVKKIQILEAIVQQTGKPLTIRINLEGMPQNLPEELKTILEKNSGESQVIFQLEHPEGYLINMKPKDLIQVSVKEDLIQQLELLCGKGKILF